MKEIFRYKIGLHVSLYVDAANLVSRTVVEIFSLIQGSILHRQAALLSQVALICADINVKKINKEYLRFISEGYHTYIHFTCGI